MTIGREPNYDEPLDDSIDTMNRDEFGSMRGGVWVTAYTKIAKQYYGARGTAKMLKNVCFEKDASPIMFSNAYPMSIPHSDTDKASVRESFMSQIPTHIANIFNSSISNRFGLVIQHGSDGSDASLLATSLIKEECTKRNLPFFVTPFFYNGNSIAIQSALSDAKQDIIKGISEKPLKNAVILQKI